MAATIAHQRIVLKAVLGIRIRRIRMFLALPYPDSLVVGMDPDPFPFLLKVMNGLK